MAPVSLLQPALPHHRSGPLAGGGVPRPRRGPSGRSGKRNPLSRSNDPSAVPIEKRRGLWPTPLFFSLSSRRTHRQLLQELFGIDRLDQMLVEAGLEGAAAIFLASIARHRDQP